MWYIQLLFILGISNQDSKELRLAQSHIVTWRPYREQPDWAMTVFAPLALSLAWQVLETSRKIFKLNWE